MTLPLIVSMFLVKIEFNVFLMEQCVESFFLLLRQHGRWRRRWCGQRISLPSSRNAFRTCMSNKEQQIFKIVHIFGRVLPIGHGIRRPMTHRKSRRRRLDNGSVSANEWRCHQFVSLECARVNQRWRRFRLSCERRIILEGIQYRRIPTKFTTEISQNESNLHPIDWLNKSRRKTFQNWNTWERAVWRPDNALPEGASKVGNSTNDINVSLFSIKNWTDGEWKSSAESSSPWKWGRSSCSQTIELNRAAPILIGKCPIWLIKWSITCPSSIIINPHQWNELRSPTIRAANRTERILASFSPGAGAALALGDLWL